MGSSVETNASLTIERAFVLYTKRHNGGSVFLVLKNNGKSQVGRGALAFRTYTDDLIVLGEFRPETEFDISPGEKVQVIAGDWQSPEKVHVRSFMELNSKSELVIDEWFAADSNMAEETDRSTTVQFVRIEAPI